MKHRLFSRGTTDTLTIFFAGWGMDEQPFHGLLPSTGDLLILWDYRTLAFDAALLAPYRRLRLAAWSMGVWAAQEVLQGVALESAVAVNGTPTPVHDDTGIPAAIFDATLANLSDAALLKFYRRMCGPAHLPFLLEHRPQRPLDELVSELAAIGTAARNAPRKSKSLPWTRALIGGADRIFPPSAQCRAWKHTPQTLFSAEPHYSPVLLREAYG